MLFETIRQESLPEELARDFLECGMHFGQPLSKRSPAMDRFVFGLSRAGNQIINLDVAWNQILQAGELVRKLTSEDKNVLFVGTNERAVSTVLSEYSERYGLHNITSRWLGGTLTNPVTRNRINYLRELEGMETSGLMDSIPAKEKSLLSKKLKKLRKNLGGMMNIRGTINAVVIIDPMHEVNATLEALKKNRALTLIAIADTNCSFSPDLFDVVIPCNTSSMSSLRKLFDILMKYYQEGKSQAANRTAASRPTVGGAKRWTGAQSRKPAVARDHRKREAQTADSTEPNAKALDQSPAETQNESVTAGS